MATPDPLPGDPRVATAHVLERIRLLIYLSERTQREIEQRLGFSRGYLSLLLGGKVDLKMWQLLAILHALELEPAEFFAEAFPRRRNRALENLDDLRESLRNKPLALELAGLFALGIESIADFSERLECCENALDELADLGILPHFEDQRGKSNPDRV